jgi:hypothetical protein
VAGKGEAGVQRLRGDMPNETELVAVPVTAEELNRRMAVCAATKLLWLALPNGPT